LKFMEEFCGEPVFLGKLEYRRALMAKDEMPTHSDGNDNIGVFIYLSGVDERRGSTAVLPGTHADPTLRNKGVFHISAEEQRKVGKAFIPVQGGPGVCLFFDGNIWHKRTETVQPGREIIWISYVRASRVNDCNELVFRRTSLQGLTAAQYSALGFGLSQPGRPSEDFKLSRRQTPSHLYFLSTGFLFRALAFRAVKRMRALVPRTIKTSVRKIFPAKKVYKGGYK
jgi:hypothetical protein